MSRQLSRFAVGLQHLQSAAVHTLYALPQPVRRLLAGPPVRIDGNELALDAQLLLAVAKMIDARLRADSVALARSNVAALSSMVGGPVIPDVLVAEVTIPGGPNAATSGGTDPDIPARLYTPDGLAAGSPLLVYFHGGGFTICSLDTHDRLCRFLASSAGLRVLSVGYRLAPEAPFPAAPADAFAAFSFAAMHAEQLGANPSAIAVGGDSAGGTLAAVTSYQALRHGGPRPVFQLLFYPVTDLVNSYRSQDLFRDGFFLTEADLAWFTGHYLPDGAPAGDPLVSPLLADDLRGMPPTYLATAGFDPLRDEGEAYGKRLRESGVPVVAHCHTDLIHGFVNFIGIGRRFREAVTEAAGALRTGLALRPPARDEDLFGKPAKARKSTGRRTP